MAAPALSTPFQPYVYQSPQAGFIPFQILGGEAQIVQIMLKPQDKILAKPGSMCYMSASVQMENILPPEHAVGNAWQWILGRNLSTTVFVNLGSQDGYIGISAPSLARILPVDLAKFGGEIICQPDAYLCSTSDVSLVPTVARRPRPGLFNGEVLTHKLVGQGLAFITVGGSIVQKSLAQGEVVVVDAGCLVATTSSTDVHIKYIGGLRRTVFGGDGVYAAHITGPGVVFIQSLPYHRLAQRIARSVTAPNVRDHPRFFLQLVIFLFLAYAAVVASLILAEI